MAVKGNHWWSDLPTSPPLDEEAELRHKRRVHRLLDVVFKGACELAEIRVTPRQARKWNNGKGKAIKFKNQAKDLL